MCGSFKYSTRNEYIIEFREGQFVIEKIGAFVNHLNVQAVDDAYLCLFEIGNVYFLQILERMDDHFQTLFGAVNMSGVNKDTNQRPINEKDVPSKRVNVNSSEADAEMNNSSKNSSNIRME